MFGLRSRVVPALTAALFYSGIAWLALRTRLRRKATVLMYHRVLPQVPAEDSYSSESIIVARTTFDRHMRLLRQHFNPVSSAELEAMLKGEIPWKPRACLVTFDDGWFDNVEHALPILEKHRIPATVFVATGFVGSGDTFWQERLTRLLHAACRLGEPARALLSRIDADSLLSLPDDRTRGPVRDVVTRLKAVPRADVDRIAADVEALLRSHGALPAGHGDDRFMAWSDVDRLRRDGLVTIGSHAHSHRPLTTLRGADLTQDLARASEEISRHLGAPANYFAYPNGDHDDDSVDAVRKSGFRLAFITRTGRVERGADPLRLTRINIGERGTTTTAGFICRALCWM